MQEPIEQGGNGSGVAEQLAPPIVHGQVEVSSGEARS